MNNNTINYLKEDILLFNFNDNKYCDFTFSINATNEQEQVKQNKSFYIKDDKITNFSSKVGFTILEFLDNYEYINKVYTEYENKIKTIPKNNINYEEFNNYCLTLIEELIEELDKNINITHISPFLINEIYFFYLHFPIEVEKKYQELIKIKNNDKSKNKSYVQEQLKRLKNISFYEFYYLELFKYHKEEFKNLYELLTNTFVSETIYYENGDKSKTLPKYKVEDLELPVSHFKLDKKKKKNIIEFSYTISSLRELGIISMYHIMLEGKIVKSCKYCHHYFITKNRREVYCNRLQNTTTIKLTTSPTDTKNIIHIESIKEVLTTQKHIKQVQIYDKDEITNKIIKVYKNDKEKDTKNIIPQCTMKKLKKPLIDKKQNKDKNISIKITQYSCKDLRQELSNGDKLKETYDRFKKTLRDRIDKKIRYSKTEEEKQKFQNQLDNLSDKISKTISEYKDFPTKTLYSQLIKKLTEFDYDYKKNYPYTRKEYITEKYWDKNLKKKLENSK